MAKLVFSPLGIVIGLVLFILAHLSHIDQGPNGFHKWRETDTVAVAANFFSETANILEPRVDVRGAGNGLVGMEFPLYSYVSGFFMNKVFFTHTWPRLLTLLGGVTLILALGFWVYGMTGERNLAGLTALALMLAPLFFFYSGKMQPDIWALAAAVTGLAADGAYLRRRKRRFVALAAIAIMVSALIKPTMLVVLAPLIMVRWQMNKGTWLRDVSLYLVAVASLVPAAIWFMRARAINAARQDDYFFLGGNFQEAWQDLTSWQFFQNTFLTWFWELGIGLPLAVFFVMGLYSVRRRFSKLVWPLSAWGAACLASFCATATHMATPHDYYFLPATPLLATVTAIGLLSAWQSPAKKMRALLMVLLASAPIYLYGRLNQRYGSHYDFVAGRSWAAEHIPSQARVVAFEELPSYLLYRSGTKGWHVVYENLNMLPHYMQQGAGYALIDARLGGVPQEWQPYVETEVARNDWAIIVKLRETRAPTALLPAPPG